MKSKIFEIRDGSFYIPVLATATNMENCDYLVEAYHWKYANYKQYSPLVIVTQINSNPLKSAYSPDEWTSKTMQIAHEYIEENFNDLKSGAVIDIQYILGETNTKRKSVIGNLAELANVEII